MKKYNTVLALDTAMNGCGVSVLSARSGRSAVCQEEMPRGQSERLIPMVCDVIRRAGLAFEDLDCIVVTLGPGAFTGVRIGLAAARALGLSLNVPVYGISTLRALAQEFVSRSHEEFSCFTALVDTRRDDFYVQDFDGHGQPLGDVTLLTSEALVPRVRHSGFLVGDAVEKLLKACNGVNFCVIKLLNPLVIAEGFVENGGCYTDSPEPLYLRAADVSFSKTKYRQLV